MLKMNTNPNLSTKRLQSNNISQIRMRVCKYFRLKLRKYIVVTREHCQKSKVKHRFVYFFEFNS